MRFSLPQPSTRLLVAVVPVLCALVLVATAAAGTLDQSSTAGQIRSNVVGGPAWVVGQTFTAGAGGALDQVDLLLNAYTTTPDGPLTVEVRTASGNLPSGTSLATTTIPASSVPFSSTHHPSWVTVTFTTPATVTAGTQYALVLSSSATVAAFETFADTSGGYAGGQLSEQPTGGGSFAARPAEDLDFKTYVAEATVSSPSRGGYCASAPVKRADGTSGVFIDLVDGQPLTDSAYATASRALYGQGYGLTCDTLPGLGYKDAGYKVDGSGVHTGIPSADVYAYYLKP